MRKFYYLVFSLFTFYSYSQNFTPPPPPGCRLFAEIDADNDGFAQFQAGWLIHDYYPAYLLAQFGFDLSGYTLQWNPPIADIYTNTTAGNSSHFIDFIYSGSGPYYEQLDIAAAYYNCFSFMPLPPNGDFDNDGILNADEDGNGNGNLLDDDSDSDWNANFLDTNVPLKTNDFKNASVSLFPNPAQNNVLFGSKVKEVFAGTTDGKKIALPVKDNSANVSELANGLYIITGQTVDGKPFATRLIKN